MDWINPMLIQQLGLTLLHFLWQGLLVGLLYAAGLFLIRPVRASSRYRMAVATLFTLALLPPLTFAWLAGQASPASLGPVGAGQNLALLVANPPATGLEVSALGWVVALWLSGVLLLSLRLALGWHYLYRLRRQADRLAARQLQPALKRLRQQFGIGRKVGLAISGRIASPVVVGWLKPLILFPPAMLAQLPMAQLEMVLAHELAHIRRHDHLVNLFQTVVETLLFYHPVVALVSRQVRIERENACDDLAVAATRDRLAYVEMLASLEKLRLPGPRLALAIHDGQILGRIRRLVEQARPSSQRGLTLPAILLVTLLAGAAGVQLMPDPTEVEAVTPITALQDNEAAPNPTNDPSARIEPRPERVDEPIPPVAVVEPATPASSAPEPASPLSTMTESMRAAEKAVEVEQPAASTLAQSPSQVEPAPPAPRPPAVNSSTIQAAPEALSQALEPGLQLAALSRPADPPRAPAPQIDQAAPAISGGQLLVQVEPDFPARARQRRIEGLVALEFLVDEQGRVLDIEVLQERPSKLHFAQAATEAVAQWRFEPFRQGEERISRRVRVELEFKPEEGCTDLLGSRIPRC
jgi:bla regulator protein blaR1